MLGNSKSTIAALRLIFASCLVIFPLFGKTAAAQSREPLESVVVTATRSERPAQMFVGSLSAIGDDELELIGHQHIQQALAQIPGVNLQRGDGQEYLPAIRSPVLTGGGACGAFLVAEDGIPVRAAGFCNINELFETHSEQAQRIEVLRGPGTALYGSNALHGIINVITPTPSPDRYSVGLEVGPWDSGRLKLFASDWNGSHGAAIALTANHDNSFRDDAGVDQQKLTLRYRYEADRVEISSGLTATNLNQETAGYIEGREAYKNDRLRDANLNPEAFRDARSLRAWSRIRYQLEGDSRLTITPYVRATDMDFRQHFLPGKPLEQNGQRSIGIQSSLHNRLGKSLELITGIDAEFSQGYLKQSQEGPTEGSAFLQTTIPQGLHYDYDVDATLAAPFSQIDWQLSDRLTLTAGLRFEHMRYDYDNQLTAGRLRDDGTACGFGGCRYSRPADRSDTFNTWSPKVGIGYLLTPDHFVYINVAHGFRAPQSTELYRLQNEQRVADLDTVTVKSIELGVKGEGNRSRYSLAAYAMTKDNVIFQDAARANVDDGETEHYGLEASLHYQLGETWDVELSGSYARHRYANNPEVGLTVDGNDIDGAPRLVGNVQLGWDLPADSRIELEWMHMGPYYLNPENSVEYDGHELFNLRFAWSPSEHWSLFARLHNVADTRYAERADYTVFSGPRYFPGMERALFAGATWEF